MAEKDQDKDEYQFVELDTYDDRSIEEAELEAQSNPSSSEESAANKQKNVKRNALIALGIIVFLMVLYKLISSMVSTPEKLESSQVTVVPETKTIQPIEPVLSPPVQEKTQPVENNIDSELKQKVSAIELSQQVVKAEISTVGQQVGTVNNNVNNLNNRIANLNQVVTNLSNQVAKQSEEINTLMARYRPKPVSKPAIIHRGELPAVYHLQAVIPGRAWLIATNGSTLTVREGTRIPGYGIVKLIDSIQGRVITSSGRSIRFSQEDS